MKRKREDIDLSGMQLRSGKVLSKVLPITIPTPVKLELKKTIDTLKSLLKDDQDFFKQIVEQCFLLGKDVYYNDIRNLVEEKYPDTYTGGRDHFLFYTIYDLETLIFGSHALIIQELGKLPIETDNLKEWNKVKYLLRTKIEQEVTSMLLEPSIDQSSTTLIGESEHIFNIDT